MLPILHLTSKKISKRNFFYLGSSKDINSRIEYFDNSNHLVDRIEMNMSLFTVIQKLKYINSKNYSNIIIEHAPNLWIQFYLFFKFGKIIYRSHNAEFLHRLHIFFCNLNHFFRGILFNNKKKTLKNLIIVFYVTFIIYPSHVVRYFLRDLFTSLFAKKILTNCQWETENYWKYFSQKKAITATPFLSGKYIKYLRDIDKTKTEKIITISGSSHPNPISVDQIVKIADYLPKIKEKMGKKFEEYKFIVTGAVPNGALYYLKKKKINQLNNFYIYVDKELIINFLKKERLFDDVINSEPLKSFNLLGSKDYESFYSLLGKSSANMFFSDKGFGFKNKSLEAFYTKNKLILPKNLAERFPKPLQKIIEKYKSVEDIISILSNLNQEDYTDIDINNELRKDSFSSYDKTFV